MKKASFLIAASLLAAVSLPASAQDGAETGRISAFGRYEGYSPESYDGRVRESRYVTVRDGTRLAVDIYRPTRNGKLAEEKLPVIWLFTPYNRATRDASGRVVTHKAINLGFTRHGYVVAIADVRGKGASFGIRSGPADANETRDAYDLTEWFATQPWSSGKVGMTGCSYYGATALQALKARPPHLKAVFAGTTTFDQYETFGHGGIASAGLADDSRAAEAVVEVDADKDRRDWKAAMALHAQNPKTGTFFASTPFRDDVNPYTGDDWWRTGSFYPYLDAMNDGAALYLYGGYRDVFPDQTITHYLNAGPRTKLAFGDWPHCDTPGFAMDTERLRFFDHWLKGVDNGIMAEAPVHVQVRRAVDGTEWRALDHWPTEAKRSRLFLTMQAAPKQIGVRGEIASLHAAALSATAPAQAGEVVIQSVPTGIPSVEYGLPRTGVDAYSATFTLPAQEKWREIIGSGNVRLWMSAPAGDADLYVYLEAVHGMGGVDVVARGSLRASHRKTGTAPYKVDGVPWQTHARADHQPLTPGEPVALDIALTPTAITLRPGDLLRLAVTSRPPVPRPDAPPPPPITLYIDPARPAWLEIPDVDTRAQAMVRGLGASEPEPMIGDPVRAARP